MTNIKKITSCRLDFFISTMVLAKIKDIVRYIYNNVYIKCIFK